LGVVAALAPVVAVGELTAIVGLAELTDEAVGLAELADEAEREGGLAEGAERLAVCPDLLAHAARIIARTARPPALNSLGALIMPSLRPQFALIAWAGGCLILKAGAQQPDTSDTTGFRHTVHPAPESRSHYFLEVAGFSVVEIARCNPRFRGTGPVDCPSS
jgi:hypothetical protein